MLIYFFERERITEEMRQKEIFGLLAQMAVSARAKPHQIQEQRVSSRSPVLVQGPEDLGHVVPLSQVYWQGPGLEVEHPHAAGIRGNSLYQSICHPKCSINTIFIPRSFFSIQRLLSSLPSHLTFIHPYSIVFF